MTKHQYLKTWKIRFLQASDLQDLTSIFHRECARSKPFLHIFKKTFLRFPSRRQQADVLMSMEASAFVNTKPRTCGQLLLHCDHRDELWRSEQIAFFVTSQISTRLRRSRQQVSNPVSSIIHACGKSLRFCMCTCSFCACQ